MGNENPQTISEASKACANLEKTAVAKLHDGRAVTVRRLNWLRFESVWQEMSQIVAAAAGAGNDEGGGNLTDELLKAPPFILKLAFLTTGIPDSELAAMQFDDVLAIAAGAIRLNFIDSAGVRDFFSALSGLTVMAGPDGR